MSFESSEPESASPSRPTEPAGSALSTPGARELRAGLSKRLPEIPCSLLYDEHGSELFELITHEPEYYQTRTELAILEQHSPDIAGQIRPREYIELGAGSGRKTHVLLDAMKDLEVCTLLDISGDFLKGSVARLAASYPDLKVRGLEADFLHELHALSPQGVPGAATTPGAEGTEGPKLVAFFAGTLGNLHPTQVPGFLSRVAEKLAPGDGFLVGIDLIKDPARIEAAYNDAAGVTARFNKNVLAVLNRRFDADFPLVAFEHKARYNVDEAWVDIRLVALRDVVVRIKQLDLTLEFAAGDEMRTELSCKYSPESFAAAAAGTGFSVREVYSDPEQLFADVLLVRDDV